MTDAINLSADLGEGFGRYSMADDESMLDIVSSANIACGFHAGDPRIMRDTVTACIERGVDIGAHPGLRDLVGFGRRELAYTSDDVYTDVLYQVSALDGMVRAQGGRMRHVTPHGALGKMTRQSEKLAEAFVQAISDLDRSLRIVSREGYLTTAAESAGLPVGYSGFADRAYNDDGELVPRQEPGAVITDEQAVVSRVLRMVREGVVSSQTGKDLRISCNSIVVHGDTPGSVALAMSIAVGLRENGVSIQSLAHA